MGIILQSLTYALECCWWNTHCQIRHYQIDRGAQILSREHFCRPVTRQYSNFECKFCSRMEEKRVELKNVGGPNFFAPRYAEYIWKEHAPNFIKYVTELDTGDSAKICKMTDAAIADIWAILEDDEKTLDILAKYSNLSISLRHIW